jgi:hypothetical protein
MRCKPISVCHHTQLIEQEMHLVPSAFFQLSNYAMANCIIGYINHMLWHVLLWNRNIAVGKHLLKLKGSLKYADVIDNICLVNV